MTTLDLAGTMRHFENGLLHNKTGPAVIYSNGFRAYYNKGVLIEAIDQDGFVLSPNFGFEFPDGVNYRRRNFMETYTKDCRYHNDNGPAVIDHAGDIRIWYNNGKEIKREKFQPTEFQLIFQETETKETETKETSKETETKETETKETETKETETKETETKETKETEYSTIEYYENGVHTHGPDGSIKFFDKNHHCVKLQHPDGTIYELDTDGYWNVTFPKTQVPKISFDVVGNLQRFTAIIGNDTYTVEVSPNTVEYRKNNQLHRDHDLPARKTKTTWEYYTNNNLIKQEQSLDPPIKQVLVNRNVLESQIGNMPNIDQEFIDHFTLNALSDYDALENFRYMYQSNKVRHRNIDFDTWSKLESHWMDAYIQDIAEILDSESNEQQLAQVIDIFIGSNKFWQKYASHKHIASKQLFVQSLYNKAVSGNYSNDFKAKLLTCLM